MPSIDTFHVYPEEIGHILEGLPSDCTSLQLSLKEEVSEEYINDLMADIQFWAGPDCDVLYESNNNAFTVHPLS